MRAHVARHARQALVRRIAPTAWSRLAALPTRPIPTCPRRDCVYQPSRRTFIASLLKKPPRDVRETEYEPGWMDIMIWRSRMLDNLKPQPIEALHKAWEQFMVYKWRSHRPLNSTQAIQCRRLLEYFCSHDECKLSEGLLFLGLRSLSLIRNPTGRAEEFAGPHHVEFAHTLLRALRLDPTREWDQKQLDRYCLPAMMMLANVGELRAGLKMCPPSRIPLNHFRMISHQVVATGADQDLEALLDWDRKTGSKHPMIPGLAIRFYAKRNKVKEVMEWVDNSSDRQHNAWDTLASFASRNGQKAWAKQLYQKLADGEPKPRYWPHIVASKLWLDEGMKGVEAAIADMSKHIQPDVGLINRLLTVAREKGDEQLANDITSLAADRGIVPDAYTFLRWLELKTDVGNFEGSKFSLDRLRHMSVEDVLARDPQARDQYEDSINAFLRLAASQKRPDFPYISDVLEQMDEIQVRLEPETVAQLSLKFLENEQFLDVMDLLAIHSFKYGESERQVVQSAFLSFCLDPNISTQRSWSAYQVLEQYFPDLERPARVQLMDEFFRRKRADMAVKVFGAMRNHRSPAYRPDDSMYRRCFEGLARNPDLANTQRAYNWLKTDTSIDPSTRLFTALMLAFTAVGRSLTALDFWKEVTACKEGPGYSTLAAVFWALENRPDGAKMAREIWSRIESMDVEVPPDVYDAYVGAIAGSGNVLEVQTIITNMASFVGSPASVMTLGIAHNALPTRELQKKFEDWAKMRYRDTWAELEKKGRRLNEFQLCHFKLQRPLEAY